MKLTCLQENLNKGVAVVSRLVSTRGTLEILGHILLKTESGRLKLSATNLEIGINYKVGAKIDKEGEITVPARIFSELVTQLPKGKINLELKNETLFTKIGDYETSLKGLSAEEFPLIPRVKEKKLISLPAADLRDAINLVTFAAAPDESRPVLAGVYIKSEKGKLVFAATDSYRLVEKTINLKSKEGITKEAIVPARSLAELARILDSTEGNDVDVYLDESQIMFETEELEFTSRLIEGQFPDYKQIIPTSFETRATASVGEFSNIVRVATLFSKEAAGSITVEVAKEGKINVVSSGSQYGESNASCAATVKGKDAEIVFNGRYLLDVFGSISGDSVSLELNGKLNPGVVRKEGDESFVYVIMPLRA